MSGQRKNEGLTYRQDRFCEAYVATELRDDPNGTLAAKAAGYADKSAHVAASRLLNMDKVQKRLNEIRQWAFDANDISPEIIAKALLNEGLTAKTDSTRVQALAWLGKAHGMFVDRVQREPAQDMDVTDLARIAAGGDEAKTRQLIDMIGDFSDPDAPSYAMHDAHDESGGEK